MSISCVEANNAVNLLNLQGYTKTESVNNSSSNEISDDFSQSDDSAKFKDIVGKYNITNMSGNEANQLYKELYDNKLVSLKDMMRATLDPTRIPGWQDGVSSVCGWEVSSNPDQKMNWLEGFKTQAEFNKTHGDSQFQRNYDDMLALAEKIKYFEG
ncbi:MAG TPA: hypothetical protein DDW90_11590 [Cyanobacteria bacterium UBA9971]|nr:hypothetical protein [Cyanobacteria bacterium UBA9971]